MNIEKDTWPEYIAKLSEVSGVKISTFKDLKTALSKRMDYFALHRCSLSDHALNYVMYAPASDNAVEDIFAARL